MRKKHALVIGLTLLASMLAQTVARAGEPIVYRDEAVIHADPATVWDIVIDLPRYAEWNPWIVYARGTAVVGTSVPVGVVLNGNVLDMAYLIVSVDAPTRFCTRDQGLFAFFVPGSRCRTVERLADGSTRFWQELHVEGILGWFADLTFGATVRAGMHAEIAAVKARAEAP